VSHLRDPVKGKKCHGCDGKGWVYDREGKPAVCPVCHGSGVYVETSAARWVSRPSGGGL